MATNFNRPYSPSGCPGCLRALKRDFGCGPSKRAHFQLPETQRCDAAMMTPPRVIMTPVSLIVNCISSEVRSALMAYYDLNSSRSRSSSSRSSDLVTGCSTVTIAYSPSLLSLANPIIYFALNRRLPSACCRCCSEHITNRRGGRSPAGMRVVPPFAGQFRERLRFKSRYPCRKGGVSV